MTERTFPAPSMVSEQAQTWRALDVGEVSYPAIEDTDAWLAMLERANRSTAQRFPISDLPGIVVDLDVDGVTMYAARPDGVGGRQTSRSSSGCPPGGLLVGGGEACRADSQDRLGHGHAHVGRGLTAASVPCRARHAIAVYRRVLQDRDRSRVFVGGDSAGGNIAAALLLRAKTAGCRCPRPQCSTARRSTSPRQAIPSRLWPTWTTFSAACEYRTPSTRQGRAWGIRISPRYRAICPASRPRFSGVAHAICSSRTLFGCIASCVAPVWRPNCTRSRPCSTAGSTVLPGRSVMVMFAPEIDWGKE